MKRVYNKKEFNDSGWKGLFIIHYCKTCPAGFIAPDYFKNTAPVKWRSCEACAKAGIDVQKQYDERVKMGQKKDPHNKQKDKPQ